MIHPKNSIEVEEVRSLLSMLDLHQFFYSEDLGIHIMAVPGGWLYDCWDGEKGVFKQGTFVPEPQ